MGSAWWDQRTVKQHCDSDMRRSRATKISYWSLPLCLASFYPFQSYNLFLSCLRLSHNPECNKDASGCQRFCPGKSCIESRVSLCSDSVCRGRCTRLNTSEFGMMIGQSALRAWGRDRHGADCVGSGVRSTILTRVTAGWASVEWPYNRRPYFWLLSKACSIVHLFLRNSIDVRFGETM